MAWGRLDPDAPHHPKFIQAGPLGWALFCAGLCYANKYLTDGFIPTGALDNLLPGMRHNACVAASAKLVEAGLWEVKPNGWQIHDFLKYHLTASEQRDMDRIAYEKSVAGGLARSRSAVRVRGRFVGASGTPASDQPVAGESAGAAMEPAHQPSDQIRSEIRSGRRKTKTPLADARYSPGFDTFWEHYPKKVSKDDAWKAWNDRDCESVADAVVTGLVNQQAYLRRDEGRWIPNPGTWLRAGRWKDEPPMLALVQDRKAVNDAWAGKTTPGDVRL
jgi:hypothetical protein